MFLAPACTAAAPTYVGSAWSGLISRPRESSPLPYLVLSALLSRWQPTTSSCYPLTDLSWCFMPWLAAGSHGSYPQGVSHPSWAKFFSSAAISMAYHDASRPWMGASLVVLFPAPIACAWPVSLLPCIFEDRHGVLAADFLFPTASRFRDRDATNHSINMGMPRMQVAGDSPASTRRCRRVSGLKNAHLHEPEIWRGHVSRPSCSCSHVDPCRTALSADHLSHMQCTSACQGISCSIRLPRNNVPPWYLARSLPCPSS